MADGILNTGWAPLVDGGFFKNGWLSKLVVPVSNNCSTQETITKFVNTKKNEVLTVQLIYLPTFNQFPPEEPIGPQPLIHIHYLNMQEKTA